MASIYPIRLLRLCNFLRDVQNGLPIDPAGLDAELNQLIQVLTTLTDLAVGITNADGSLRFSNALREMKLIETLTFTGVSGATQEVTVPTYNTATDLAEVFVNGLRLDPSTVAYTDTTHITITHAFVGGEDIIVDLSSNGAGALTSLASTAVNLGASLVGIYDVGSLFTSTTVESALQEVMTDLNTLITSIGTLANYILANGTVAMAAALAMGGNKITGLADGTVSTDACTFGQLTAYANIWNDLAANFLPLGGGTMSGQIDMGNENIVDLADPVDAHDAATKNYVDTQLPSVTSPVGAIVMYAGLTAPVGWLICDGSQALRSAYPNLNTLLSGGGYPYGDGDGSTTFNLPDFRGRVPVGTGAGPGLTVRSLKLQDAAHLPTQGEEAHVQLITELVEHTHEIKNYAAHFGGGSLDAYTNDGSFDGTVTGPAWDGATAAASQPMNVMNPFTIVSYIIRAN